MFSFTKNWRNIAALSPGFIGSISRYQSDLTCPKDCLPVKKGIHFDKPHTYALGITRGVAASGVSPASGTF